MATPYCDKDDVKALISQLTISATGTKPTDAQVEAWIAEITAQINGILAAADYPTDILVGTYPETFKVLTNLCAMEAASRAVMVSQYAMEAAGAEQAAFYHEQFESGMKKIRTIPSFLYEAAGGDAGGGGRLRSLATDDATKDRDPWFTTDKEF